jgi:hypothetical protein
MVCCRKRYFGKIKPFSDKRMAFFIEKFQKAKIRKEHLY